MMLGVAPISASLIEILPQVGPVKAVGDQAQFQQNLVQAAASKEAEIVPAAAVGAAPIPPTSEVQRTTTQTSSLGERILENLSAVHRRGAAPAAPATEPAIVKAAGPAEQSLLQPGGAAPRVSGKPPAADNFEAMVATLHSVYNNVIQVSLISKSTGSFSSSLNKLMSAG